MLTGVSTTRGCISRVRNTIFQTIWHPLNWAYISGHISDTLRCVRELFVRAFQTLIQLALDKLLNLRGIVSCIFVWCISILGLIYNADDDIEPFKVWPTGSGVAHKGDLTFSCQHCRNFMLKYRIRTVKLALRAIPRIYPREILGISLKKGHWAIVRSHLSAQTSSRSLSKSLARCARYHCLVLHWQTQIRAGGIRSAATSYIRCEILRSTLPDHTKRATKMWWCGNHWAVSFIASQFHSWIQTEACRFIWIMAYWNWNLGNTD